MTLKYTNIFNSKAHQNSPKLGFWFENIQSGNPVSNRLKVFTKNLCYVLGYVELQVAEDQNVEKN
jgi:hypothetical protein